MAKKHKKPQKLKARLPRGFVDRPATEIRSVNAMLDKIRTVYESYGFDPIETPLFEYTDALGKFLPDTDRPNAGVFSLTDDDEQWLSLRYDLTAPLARHVAQNYQLLALPFRSYRQGYVFRNERPGPGRFRQFMQFDADTVGASNVAADAEMCMMMADCMDVLGLEGKYIVRVNNRKVLDGVMEVIGLSDDEQGDKRLIVLRAIDKLDRLGIDGVRALLGQGRKDDSGDVTKGAGLDDASAQAVLDFVQAGSKDASQTFANLRKIVSVSERGMQGVAELETMANLFAAASYGADKIFIDPSVVRGLEYYTGPVYEAELTFEVPNEKGQIVQFGSVGGGGRYDGLVSRFMGQPVPATGFSIGVSRLASALKATGNLTTTQAAGPVVVAVMDKSEIASYQQMVTELRNAGIRAEMYLGNGNLGKQFKYADQRASPCVIVEGTDERDQGQVQIKDLIAGALAAKQIEDNEEWRAARPAQITVDRATLVENVQAILASQEPGAPAD